MRTNTLNTMALVALYSTAAVAGPIDSVRRYEPQPKQALHHRGLLEMLAGLGLGGAKVNTAPPPQEVQPPKQVPSTPPQVATGVLPPSGVVGTAPGAPKQEPTPPPTGNGTASPPACAPVQAVTVTVTQTVAGNCNGAAPTNPGQQNPGQGQPPAQNPPAQPQQPPPAGQQPPPARPTKQPPAQSPSANPQQPPPAGQNPPQKPPGQQPPPTKPVAIVPAPLPTPVVTTVAPAPLDPNTPPKITNSAGQPPGVPQTQVPGGINQGIGGSTGNSGTINNIQIVVIQFIQPGVVQTVTSTVNGVPQIATVTASASTVLSTVTLTEGASPTGTGLVLPPGAQIISNVTLPAQNVTAPPAQQNEAQFPQLNATASAIQPGLATGVLPPPGSIATGILPPPGAIESGASKVSPSAAPTPSKGVLPPPGAIESGASATPSPTPVIPGVLPPPGAFESGASPSASKPVPKFPLPSSLAVA